MNVKPNKYLWYEVILIQFQFALQHTSDNRNIDTIDNIDTKSMIYFLIVNDDYCPSFNL